MPTNENDYMNWQQNHANKENKRKQKEHFKKESAIKEYNHALKKVEDYPIIEYQQPLAKVLTWDLRQYTLEELKKQNYNRKIDDDTNYYLRAA